MKKAGYTYFRRKLEKKGDTLFLLFCCFLGLYFLAIGIQDVIALKNWDVERFQEYSGSYELSEKKYFRNINYRFALANGDVIEVPCEYVVQVGKLENNFDGKGLEFRYQTYRHPLRNVYEPISIKSTADGTIFVQEELMKDSMQSSVGLYLILGICALIPVLVLGAVHIVPAIHMHLKRNKKK